MTEVSAPDRFYFIALYLYYLLFVAILPYIAILTFIKIAELTGWMKEKER